MEKTTWLIDIYSDDSNFYQKNNMQVSFVIFFTSKWKKAESE